VADVIPYSRVRDAWLARRPEVARELRCAQKWREANPEDAEGMDVYDIIKHWRTLMKPLLDACRAQGHVIPEPTDWWTLYASPPPLSFTPPDESDEAYDAAGVAFWVEMLPRMCALMSRAWFRAGVGVFWDTHIHVATKAELFWPIGTAPRVMTFAFWPGSDRPMSYDFFLQKFVATVRADPTARRAAIRRRKQHDQQKEQK
jgi:hypothetical protein